MSQGDILDPQLRSYERFLHASVGEDRNGALVTVLSMLARLDLDPWKETATLAALKREAAQLRLTELLSRSRSVPALATDPGTVAEELSLLLPESPASDLQQAGSTGAIGRMGSNGMIWILLALAFVLLQFLFNIVPGSGQ
jgi:hypothetical protein